MSVFGSEEDIPTGINWSEVFRDASVNGVSALCYEAVRRLPVERQPNVDLLLRWQLSARSIREQFRYRHDVTRSLFDILNEKGIGTLLLRGETLACNYPDPELRESSLVGFTALTGTRTCDSLLWSHGIAVSSQRNLSSFTYKGVRFENYNLDESLPLAVRRSDGCLEPDPVTQAVLVVMHIARQVRCSDERIPLKALLDLALLLCHYPDIVESWEPKLRKVRLHRFSRVMLCAINRLFGSEGLPAGISIAWNRRTMRRARKFIRIFMTDNNVNARHLARHAFLPPRIWEWLRIMFERDSKTDGSSAHSGE